MNDMSRIVLCNFKSQNLQWYVTAEVKGGILLISGQDFSTAGEQLFGDSEYEYFYSLNKEDTEKLKTILGERSFRKALKENFSGLDGCKTFREICEMNGLRYEFNSYCG